MPAKGVDRAPEPLGVALVIAPWNYPIQLLVEPIAAALAAGNCVAGQALGAGARLFGGAGATAPALRRPRGRHRRRGRRRRDHRAARGAVGPHLLHRLDAVGRVVAEAAAKHLTPTTLELGGKSPTYVHASAEPRRRRAPHRLGQVPQRRPDLHRARLRARRPRGEGRARRRAGSEQIREFYGADPQRSTSFGRIVNERHLDRLAMLLADGEGAGTVAIGGKG